MNLVWPMDTIVTSRIISTSLLMMNIIGTHQRIAFLLIITTMT